MLFHLAAFSLILSSAIKRAYGIWPIPRTLSSGSHAILLSPQFEIQTNFANPPNDLLSSVSRTKDFLFNDNLQRLVIGRGQSDLPSLQNAPTLRSLSLHLTTPIRNISEEAIVPLGKRSEEYTLSVPDNGDEATLSANSTLGLLRGLTTFEQLWYTYDNRIYTLQTPLNIVDNPAFVRIFG